jgi:hypothetical protein
MYAAAQAAGGEGGEGAGTTGAGPDFTKQSSADDGVVDAEVVDEGPAEENK